MTESIVELGLAVICETCESEIDLEPDSAEGLCRHCGLAFLLDDPPVQAVARTSLGGLA